LIKYLISDPLHKYKNFEGVDYVCYRNKSVVDFEKQATEFIDQAKADGVKNIFLSEDYLLADRLGISGVHLTSQQFSSIEDAQKRGLKVIISCHCEEEIQTAMRKNVDFITYSPIFNTPNKGKAKGIENLKMIVSRYNIKIIALGGILTADQITQVKESGAVGFASIRHFIQKE